MDRLKNLEALTQIAYQFVDENRDSAAKLNRFVCSLRDTADCEAVAIRMEKDGDYPFIAHTGLPESFIAQEDSILTLDSHGNPITATDGYGFHLDCMCGQVIRGVTDTEKPFFTKFGTFFSNSISSLLAETTEEERGGTNLSCCNACGYESVVLTPLIHRGVTVGLIQLNDHRPNRFTLPLILSIELLADLIALTVHLRTMTDAVRSSLPSEDINDRKTVKMCSNCKSIQLNKNGRWKPVEVFISAIADIEMSHTVCEKCREETIMGFLSGLPNI